MKKLLFSLLFLCSSARAAIWPIQQGQAISPTFSTVTLTNPLAVPSGGTGQSSLPSMGVLVGSGTAPIGATAPLGNGGLIIGGGVGNIPSTGTLTANDTAQIVITNNAGSIVIGTPQDIGTISTPTYGAVNMSSGNAKGQFQVGTLKWNDGTTQTTAAAGETNTYSSSKTFDAANGVKITYGLNTGSVTVSSIPLLLNNQADNTNVAIRFGGAANYGWYSADNYNWDYSDGGNRVWTMGTALVADNAGTVLRGVAGSCSAPFYSWASNSSTGFWNPTGNKLAACIGGTASFTATTTSATFHGTGGLRVDGPINSSSATFVGVSVATITAGAAGASQTVLCLPGTFALGGGCGCSGGVAITGDVDQPNCTTFGCIPTGWTCQEPGGTGGTCAAYAICSRLQ